MGICILRGKVKDPNHGIEEGPSDKVMFWAYSPRYCISTHLGFNECMDYKFIHNLYIQWLNNLDICDPLLITSWNYEYQLSAVPDTQKFLQ